MSYYISTTLEMPLEQAVQRVTEALAQQGFGVLTSIDIATTLKKKLDVDFRPYVILGACNPGFAYQALQNEDKIGTMSPCNVIVQEVEAGRSEVAAVDPVASMTAVTNPALEPLATQVRERLQAAVASL